MAKHVLWGLVGILLPLLGVACQGGDLAPTGGAAVGAEAPDFRLEAIDGETYTLSQFRGNVVLINLWATWCEPCQEEIPTLEAAYRARQGEGFAVLGVSIGEDGEVVGPFAERMGITYPVLLDAKGTLMERYRALGLPMSVLVGRDGLVAVRHVGILSEDELDDYLGPLLAKR